MLNSVQSFNFWEWTWVDSTDDLTLIRRLSGGRNHGRMPVKPRWIALPRDDGYFTATCLTVSLQNESGGSPGSFCSTKTALREVAERGENGASLTSPRQRIGC